jgi:sugar lactone lactonase YvrE
VGAIRTLADDLWFPEGMRWHDGALWFSDVSARRVMRLQGDAAPEMVVEFEDDEPSGLGFLPDGTPLVALMWSRRVMRLDDGVASVHADLGHLPGGWFNDMVVDGAGRAYVGHPYPPSEVESPYRAALQPPDPEGEALVLVEPSGASRIVARDVHGPNGMVISDDGRTLVLAESPNRRLTAFTIGEDGELSDRRLFADLGDRRPDGLAIDAEGAIWAGIVSHGHFARILPGGEIARIVELPAPVRSKAIAPALGGADRGTLYMSSVITENTTTLRDRHRCQGFLDAVEVEVPGAGWP